MRGCWEEGQLVKSRMNRWLRAGRNLCNPLGLCEVELCMEVNQPLRGGISFCSWIGLCIFKRDNREIIFLNNNLRAQ